MHIKGVFERGDSEDRNLESVGKEKAPKCEIAVVTVSNTGLLDCSDRRSSKQVNYGC